MVVSDFHGKTIFLDTAPLIYFIEGHSTYQQILSQLFWSGDRGEINFIASSITLLEVLVAPLRAGRIDIADSYTKFLTESDCLEIIDVTNSISIAAAKLRANYNLKTPDALLLATAIENGADYFLTNDLRLKNISETKVITLLEIQPH